MAKWGMFESLAKSLEQVLAHEYVNLRVLTNELRFLIEDYVLHMQHRLDHILNRDKLTQYPGAAAGI